MSVLGSRHAGDAGGRIRSSEDATSRPVLVEIPSDVGGRIEVQHAAQLLVNLLARSADFVTTLSIRCGDHPLHDGIFPGTNSSTLRGLLIDIASTVGEDAVSLVDDPPERAIRLVLGPGPALADGWRIHGAAWRGRATRGEIADDVFSPLPLGPYIAACLGAAVVCWITRGKNWHGKHLELSAWDLTSRGDSGAGTEAGPSHVSAVLELVLAGAGAVGTSFLLAAWACPGLAGEITAADFDVVDETNRNRCLLFFQRHVGGSKTDAINELFAASSALRVVALEQRGEAMLVPTSHLVSAVDTPESREALQQRYPRSIIQASTDNVRVELLRCDPVVGTACLRCYNQPRSGPTDESIRREFGALSPRELHERALELGTEVATLTDWIQTGRCSEVTGRLLSMFRTRDDEHAFSIGFASALAGVLLAAQAVKDALVRGGHLEPGSVPLHGEIARARFALLDLDSRACGPNRYARDSECPACAPGAPAHAIWSARFRGSDLTRSTTI